MGKQIQIRVDESLAEILEKVRKDVAEDIKRKYNLEEVTMYGTLSSQILAAKLSGKKVLNFEIDKVSLNKGVLRLI